MKTRKILIVNDDFSRSAMEKLLQGNKYETFSCALGKVAIAQLKQKPYNLFNFSIKTIFAFIFFLLTVFGVQPLGAQGTFPPPQKRTEGQGAFWHSPSLGLTEAQTKELENIKQAFIEEAAPLWRELRALNLELRYVISDPNVKSQTLFDRQRRISELRVKLESLLLSSQVKARSVLTKEQFDRLSRDCTLGMGTIYEVEIGIDRRLQRGIRY